MCIEIQIKFDTLQTPNWQNETQSSTKTYKIQIQNIYTHIPPDHYIATILFLK